MQNGHDRLGRAANERVLDLKALSEEGPVVQVFGWLMAPPSLLPDGWMLISFLVLVHTPCRWSCPGCSIP
jgi:hypothetical protein